MLASTTIAPQRGTGLRQAAKHPRPLAAEIIAFCEAFGHTAEILLEAGSSHPVNGVGALCWNYPCGGYRLLRTDGSGIIARVGYGYQRRPGQFLAMLAGNGVPPAYEIRIGEHKATVADLVAAEKAACLAGSDLSGVLFGLAFYTEPGETWQNAQGDAWSVERLVHEELDRTADPSSVAVIDRLAGLSFAAVRIGDEKWADASLAARVKAHRRVPNSLSAFKTATGAGIGFLRARSNE